MIASADEDVQHRFKGWHLIPLQRLLVVNGTPVDLGARAFDLLLALVERRTRVVSKEELLALVWPGRVVEENNISVHIAALRKLLGPRVIATISGVGYRLSAEVETAAPVKLQPDTAALSVDPDHPQPRLFGRSQDMAALLARVGVHALVSITGPGGVGKTALARQVLGAHAKDSQCMLHWIDLTPLRPGDSVAMAVAAGIGVVGAANDGPGDLLTALSHMRALIALDNCEHMAADVGRLVFAALEVAPDVRWVATSQVPLHLAQEDVYQLHPLEVPARDASFADAMRGEAIALLRARAAAAYRPFELTQADIGLAIDICAKLDGLPLAIEMAASRIATLGVATVHEQLHQKLLLSNREYQGPERQQTLRCAFDWSYGLLTRAEQRLFRSLEPFLGGFTARMARQMVSASPDTDDGPEAWEALEALSVLVERSLVHRAPDGRNRYFLFESARDYARARLEDAGEVEAVAQRHAEVVALWFANARSDYDGMRDADWATKYLDERHNVRAALSWSCRKRTPDLLARHVAALAQIDSFSRNDAEILHCGVPLDTLLEASTRWRAAACVELSWAHFLDGNRKTGSELARQAAEDFRALGDQAGAYQALAQLIRLYEARPGMMAQAREAASTLAQIDEDAVPLRTRLFRACMAGLQYADGERTVARLQELHDLAARSGYDTLASVCRAHITDQLLIERRFEEVVVLVQRFEEAGEKRPRVRAMLMVNLVLALVQLGRAGEAAGPVKIIVSTLPSSAYHVVRAFALAAVRERNFGDAALLMGYADRVHRDREQHSDPAEAAAEEEILHALSQALDPSALADKRRLGRALTLQEALSFIP